MPDVTLTLGGERFRGWTSLSLARQIDAVDKCEFVAPFDPDSPEQRARFRPFSYPAATLAIDDQQLFTGTAVAFTPTASPDSVTVSIGCYGKPGVLSDCSAGFASLPTEFIGLNVRQIAEQVLDPFGVSVSFDGDIGGAFDKVALNASEKVMGFLAKLANDRGLYITNTSDGNLLFTSAATADPLPRAQLDGSNTPVVSVAASFKPQQYFSEITGLVKAKKVRAGSRFTANNPFLTGVYRPIMYELKDVEPADAEKATRSKLGRMFGNMVTYSVELATIFDQLGSLWAPNTYVDLVAPGAMLYQKTRLLIRTATLTLTATEQKASLELVLPGAFSGDTPESLPWD